MADQKPLKYSATSEETEFGTGDTVAVANGGTGATTASGSRLNLVTAWGLLEAETEALINAMTTRPSRKLTFLYDDLVVALKAASVWTNLTGLYLFAAANSQAAGLNLVNPTGAAISAVSSPTFTALQGYTGNGTSSYLDTQTTITSGSHYVQDSASMGVVSRVDRVASASKREFGTLTGQTSFLNVKNTTPALSTRVNDSTAEQVASASAVGFFAASRTVSTTVSLYSAASGATTAPTKTDVAVASSSAPTGINATFLQSNGTNFSDAQLSAGFWGAGLTQTQMNALYTALKTFLSDASVGAWL